MYATIDETVALTGYTVDHPTIVMAQSIIEMYTGRTEARVEDPDDLLLLKQATAYQAAYMHDSREQAFQQVHAKRIQQDSFSTELFNEDAPMIAPLAAMACKRLSWARSRSVTTAPNKRRAFVPDWWTD